MKRPNLKPLVAKRMTLVEMSEHTGMTIYGVRKALEEQGLRPNGRGRGRKVKLTRGRVIQMVRKACREDLTQAQIAEEMGVTSRTLRNALDRYGLEWSDQT